MKAGLAALVLCGCDVVFGVSPPVATVCSMDADCVDAAGGICDCGHCSYLETSCALSNRKWPASAPGALADACVPVPSQIDARVFHTCMRMSDGTAWCWGSNSNQQLGPAQPAGTASSYPVQIVDATGAPLQGVAEIRTSAATSCARLVDDTVWCWGSNAHGELGAGLDPASNPSSAVPVQVTDLVAPLASVRVLAMGYHAGCAVVGDAEVRCWGWNTSGILGEPVAMTPHRDRAAFTTKLAGIIDLSMGGEHACGVSDTNGVREGYCWGQQGSGRLGNGLGDIADQLLPTRVNWGGNVPMPDLLDVAAGNRHTCGFKLPGRELYCWGQNDSGQLGDTTVQTRTVATQVSHALAQVVDALAAGDRHSCMTTGTETWCWGTGESGELGTGAIESEPRTTPVQVQLDKQLRSLTVGHSHTCVIGSDLLVRCWGSNQHGELGDGSVDTRLAPTIIARDTYCPSRD